MVIRSCSSFLCGFLISRTAWRRPSCPLYLALRPALPPATRFLSSARRSAKRSAAKTPMDSGEPFYVVRKGDVIGIYKTLGECQAQVSSSVRTFALVARLSSS